MAFYHAIEAEDHLFTVKPTFKVQWTDNEIFELENALRAGQKGKGRVQEEPEVLETIKSGWTEAKPEAPGHSGSG